MPWIPRVVWGNLVTLRSIVFVGIGNGRVLPGRPGKGTCSRWAGAHFLSASDRFLPAAPGSVASHLPVINCKLQIAKKKILHFMVHGPPSWDHFFSKKIKIKRLVTRRVAAVLCMRTLIYVCYLEFL